MKKALWGLFLLLVFSLIAEARQVWDLKRCIEYALANNIQLRQADYTVLSAQDNAKAARYARLPNLTATGGPTYSVGRSFDVFTNQPVEQGVTYFNYRVSSNFVLYNGGRLTHNIRRAEAAAQASEFARQRTKNEIILAVANAYLQVVFSYDLIKTAKALKQNIDAQIARTQSLISNGALPENVIYDLLAQQANSELQIVTAENTQSVSYLQLRQVMQLPEEEPFEILLPEVVPPDTPLTAKAADYYAQAVGVMPEIKAAQLQEKAAQIAIRVARADFQPTVFGAVGFGSSYSSAQKTRFLGRSGVIEVPFGYIKDKNNPNDTSLYQIVYTLAQDPKSPAITKPFGFRQQMREGFNYNFSASVSIPFYNRHQTRNAVRQAELQWERSKLDVEAAKNTLRRTIESAYNDVLIAQRTFIAQTKRVNALKESLRIMRQRFENGAANSFELSQSEAQFNAATFDLTRSRYDYYFKIKVLEFYTGKEISF